MLVNNTVKKIKFGTFSKMSSLHACMQGLQRQKQKQALNTYTFNCLIRKQKKTEVPVKSEEDCVLMVTSQPEHEQVTFGGAIGGLMIVYNLI